MHPETDGQSAHQSVNTTATTKTETKQQIAYITLHTAAVASSGDVFFVADLLYLQMAHENGGFVKAAMGANILAAAM